jgi:hypothetical protein
MKTILNVLFSGKRKLISIPIIGIIAISLLPIILGLLALWFTYKKVGNIKLKLALLSIIGFLLSSLD